MMQRMSRAQRILAMYLLWKLSQPRVIQKITKISGGGGPISIAGLATKDHDLLDGLLDDDHTQYLLHDGTRVMTGSTPLDFGVARTKFYTKNLCLRESSDGSTLEIVNRAETLWNKYIKAARFYAGEITAKGFNDFKVQTNAEAAGRCRFRSYTGAAWVTHIDMINGVMNLPNTGNVTLLTDKALIFTESTVLTIDVAGGITVLGNNVIVETRGGAGTDDLDTISGGTDGMLIVLRAANDAHTIVCRDGVGNLSLAGGVNFSLDSDCDTLQLFYDGTQGLWLELARADNA